MSGFQSLSGFLYRCDFRPARRDRPEERSFQSLSGFLYRCDIRDGGGVAQQVLVSIPIGFSLSLRRPCGRRGCSRSRLVSIPIGFSLSLRRGGDQPSRSASFAFQSLSGFLYRCDSSHAPPISMSVLFQSLSGFLYRCDEVIGEHPIHGSRFQSLSGFLYRCDLPGPDDRLLSGHVSIPIGFSLSLRLPGDVG